MKTAKLRKSNKKEEEKALQNEYSVKNMIITVSIISVVFLLFYLVTTFVVKPVEETNISNTVTEIDTTKITLGNLLNRKDKEYYVLVLKESMYKTSYNNINYTEIYDKYISDYSTKETSLPFYKVDLDDALNKNFVDEKLNITDDLGNLKINNEVLFKIKDGKIEKYFVGNSDIVDALSILK